MPLPLKGTKNGDFYRFLMSGATNDRPPLIGPVGMLVHGRLGRQCGRRSWSGLRSRPRGHCGHECEPHYLVRFRKAPIPGQAPPRKKLARRQAVPARCR